MDRLVYFTLAVTVPAGSNLRNVQQAIEHTLGTNYSYMQPTVKFDQTNREQMVHIHEDFNNYGINQKSLVRFILNDATAMGYVTTSNTTTSNKVKCIKYVRNYYAENYGVLIGLRMLGDAYNEVSRNYRSWLTMYQQGEDLDNNSEAGNYPDCEQ